MATFLDVSLIGTFGNIFIVLLVFLIVFGILEYIKAFGPERKGLHGIIALVIGLLFLISKTASNMIRMMVPWLMVLAIFLFFGMFMIRMFGRTEADMRKLIADPQLYPWIIVLLVLILIFSLGNAFGQSLLERGEGTTPTEGTGSVDGTGTVVGPDGTPLQTPTAGTTSTTTSSFSTNMLNTIRHPKVLGMIFIFMVGMFALMFLTKLAK